MRSSCSLRQKTEVRKALFWEGFSRLLAASLIGVISVLMIDSAAIAGVDLGRRVLLLEEATPLVPMAEFGRAVFYKAIIVSDLSPNIDPKGASAEIGEFQLCDCVSSPLPHFCSRWNYIPADDFPNRKVILSAIRTRFEANEPADISRGKIANVAKANMPISVAATFEWNYSKWVGADVGALDNSSITQLVSNPHIDMIPRPIVAKA